MKFKFNEILASVTINGLEVRFSHRERSSQYVCFIADNFGGDFEGTGKSPKAAFWAAYEFYGGKERKYKRIRRRRCRSSNG